MFSNRITKALILLATARAAQDCMCGSAGNSQNPYGDISRLMNGSAVCATAPQMPMYNGLNTGVGEQCANSANGGGYPQYPPYTQQGNEECELTTSIDCKPRQTQPGFSTYPPSYPSAPSYPTSTYPSAPSYPPTPVYPQPGNGNGNCDCSNSYNGNNGNNGFNGGNGFNGNNGQICDCSGQNGGNGFSSTNQPLYVAAVVPQIEQACDCSNRSLNGGNFGGNGNNGQMCDCSGMGGMGSQNGYSTYPGSNQVPCMTSPGAPGTFSNLMNKANSPFNLTECTRPKPTYNVRTAVIGKTEMPISDNVTFAPSTCALANQTGGCA